MKVNRYYEINKTTADRYYNGITNFAEYGIDVDRFNDRYYRLMAFSDRVWQESNNGVKYIKNRRPLQTEVDMKEFMWTKLKSHQLSIKGIEE